MPVTELSRDRLAPPIAGDATTTITLNVNAQDHVLKVKPSDRLSHVLRRSLDLTGLKEGCLEGECGACTVLINDDPVNSCLVLAFQVQGKRIVTIEGLQPSDDSLAPLQQAFLSKGAVQCGFCSPGMVLAAQGLLNRNPDPTEAEIRHALAGNLCRCTGFQSIVEAVKAVAAQ